MMLNKLILIIGLVGAVNLHCADRGEDSKSAVPVIPRDSFVPVNNGNDLIKFLDLIVAFKGQHLRGIGEVPALYQEDLRFGCVITHGVESLRAFTQDGYGKLEFDDILESTSKGEFTELRLKLRKVTPSEAKSILDVINNSNSVDFEGFESHIKDSLERTIGQAGAK